MGDIVGAEAEELSAWNIRAWDKWYRMLMGIASNLERFENGVMYLRINNLGTRLPSDCDTARRFADNWRGHNPELKCATGFVAIFYQPQAPRVPVAIYSGLF